MVNGSDVAGKGAPGVSSGPHLLLTPEEAAAVDRMTIEEGIEGSLLMERAGAGVARIAADMAETDTRVAVLCGPGNNGGDGYVAARHLHRLGYRPEIFSLVEPAALAGDAARAASAYRGERLPLPAFDAKPFALVIDALFGAGLARPVAGAAGDAIARANASGAPVLAVDLPSGVDGESGIVRGEAIRARRTVTFGFRKPGHLLLPGRGLCGRVDVVGIGLSEAAVARVGPRLWENRPELWRDLLPSVDEAAHKYLRGHVAVLSGGPASTGAARMAAAAAQRAGAGAVTVLSPPSALLINASHLTSIMVRAVAGPSALGELLGSGRIDACVLGPGAGVDEHLRSAVRSALSHDVSLVLDADALTVFADEPAPLFDALRSRSASSVLTPHEGEFGRLFADIDPALGKVERARRAAGLSGGVVVLKGADTVVAHHDGRAVISDHSCRWLATAGSGDVLAGVVAALLAGGMPDFEAACAAVWLHGDAGRSCGVHLIAEDLIAALPNSFRRVRISP